MTQEDFEPSIRNGVETFKSISPVQFLNDFNLPKIDYEDGPEDLNPVWAKKVANMITDDWTLPVDRIQTSHMGWFSDGTQSTDGIILPYVYYLYALEIGIVNTDRFFSNKPHIFFPPSTDAYEFANDKSLFKASIKNIPNIRSIRKALEQLISPECLLGFGFHSDLELIEEEENRDGAKKFLSSLQQCGNPRWRSFTRVVEEINPMLLY